jgi:hypothetical protein
MNRADFEEKQRKHFLEEIRKEKAKKKSDSTKITNLNAQLAEWDLNARNR